MKLAFIFAHPDDESLSTGGTIAKYAAKSNQVITACLSSDSVRKSEYLEAIKTLGVEKNLILDYPDVHNN
ncbi:MAG: PIG-L family deacetylase, partial [Candidatus Heimdallarchaeota archaeon]|nr:PIG-L family deacetylase [Candidatus Heimdallarchaeota archaeon]MCK4876589.1 PIG-L family deacetylase [Candidatus Heimdallarchaeota archaeon]